MTELRVHNFSISLDGFAAGPHQDADNPLGVGGEQLHEWIFPEGRERTAVDEAFVARGVDGIGATIMGRNMFGPVRGGWADSPRLDRLVGRRSAVPPRRLRPHPSPAPVGGDGRRHHFPLRARRHRGGTGAGTVRGWRTGGPTGRRGRDRPGVPARRTRGRPPPRRRPRTARGRERLFDDDWNALDGWRCVEYAPSETVAHVRLRRQ